MLDWEKQNIENAEHYGYDAQSRQMIEEMAELTKAINKFWRKNKCDVGIWIPKKGKELEQIVEEIADVEVMLHQIKHLLGINPKYVEQIKIEKVNRTKERIAREMI